MPSTRRKDRPVPRGRTRRRQDDIPDDEVESSSGDDDDSSTQNDGSDASSSAYEGLSSDDERGAVEDRPGKSERGREEDDETEGGDVSASSAEKADEESYEGGLLSRLLSSDPTLTRMDITHRHLKDWSSGLPIEDIMIEIANQSSLETLGINLEYVTMSKYHDILECVSKTETLKELILSGAKVNRHTANDIASALAENPDSLKKVTFKQCSFAGSGFPVLFLGVQHASELTHLSIEDCSLQGFASEIISATVPLMKKIQSLRLVGTQFPLDGLRYLFDNLLRSKTLIELDLSDNELDPESMTWLVGFLKDADTKIEHLSLIKCGLDPSSIELLCRGLMEDKHLTTLTLHENVFGTPGAIALVNLLKENHHLQSLGVKDCKIGKKTLLKLHDGLRYNTSFLKNMFSSEFSLAILDTVGMVEKIPGSFS
jgi:Ran GTPase-activating protein (RanGAP) involved in mRNA processing and transport